MPASSERDVRVRALLGAELVAGCSEGLTPAQPSRRPRKGGDARHVPRGLPLNSVGDSRLAS